MVGSLVAQLMAAWESEPGFYCEERWTCPGGHGWHCWGGEPAEVEFCEFVGALTALLRPRLVVETGVGAGYSTRRIISQLPEDGRWLGFESDPEFRAALIPHLTAAALTLSEQPSPSEVDMAEADLVLLDSAMEFRFAEFDLWVAGGKAGSVLFCHDVSNRVPGTGHAQLWDHIGASGMAGIFASNPRGSWIGQHP